MEFSDDVKAILLLRSHLRNGHSGVQKPLTLPQWNRLRIWLDQCKQSPQDLFHDKYILLEWEQQHRHNLSVKDMDQLLDRGLALADASLRWQQAGVWFMTYLDDDYPDRINTRLAHKLPPLFFGIGNRSLLQCGGLAVVGSRSAPQEDLDYTRQLGNAAAHEEVVIVSGGAKGVDITAMDGCLEEGGDVVGVLSDRLLRRSMDPSCRDYLENGQLVFISEKDPEVKLSRYEFPEAAMGRNKYIYCLSDAAVVVRSGKKGGTITGAIENLKYSWVPLWVKKTKAADAGNKYIIPKGAQWLSEDGGAEEHLRSMLGLKESEPTNSFVPTNADQEMVRTAVLLLTVNLNSDPEDQANPMGIKEWGRFAQFLMDRQLTPAHLLSTSVGEVLQEWNHSSVTIERVNKLLDESRQDKLPKELKSWRQSRINAVIRRDSGYPKVLITRLIHESPPVLFIAGKSDLLTSIHPKIMVLGSARVTDESDMGYAKSVGKSLANSECILISVDRTRIEQMAVQSSLDSGGKCIIVLKGNLKKKMVRSRFWKHIENGRLAILSASPPHAKSTSLDYDECYDIACCLSSAALVVCSGKKDIIARCVNRCTQQRWIPIFKKPEQEMPRNRMIFENEYDQLLQGRSADIHVKFILGQENSVPEAPFAYGKGLTASIVDRIDEFSIP